jgi:hypothetical protein
MSSTDRAVHAFKRGRSVWWEIARLVDDKGGSAVTGTGHRQEIRPSVQRGLW